MNKFESGGSLLRFSTLLRGEVFSVLISPFNLLAVLPVTRLGRTVATDVGSLAVLFATAPPADVLAAVGPAERTPAFALIVDKLALIALHVPPDENALTVHLVVVPLSVVLLAIGPMIVATAADLVLPEVTLVLGAVSECQLAFSLLFAVDIAAFILGTIRP